MAMKFSAPPKPRAGTQRNRPRPQRITPLSRGTTPTFRASTPSRQQTPSDGPVAPKPKRPCANADCPNPNVKLTDDMSAYVCQTCGVMANETANLVSEPGFVEGQGGRITALGVQVGAGQSHQRGAGKMQGTGHVGQELTSNRKAAEFRVTEYMRVWLNNLHYPAHEADAGLRIFGLAWQWQFIKGRSLSDVAIVCLYLALRRARHQVQGHPVAKYSVMLIDFAEIADVDVFSLGKMFGDLMRRIYPGSETDPEKEKERLREKRLLMAHGPEVLIPRFVDSLDFPPGSSSKIRDDAIKIVRRMNRDWMADGRRPAGVCGAAVILAARMNNHRRSTREVMLTAKVTEITLNKRLEEFSDLPSSKLSVNEFRDDSVREAISAADPPAYTRARLGPQPKKKRGRKRKTAPETAAEIERDEESDHDDAEPPAKRPRVDAEGFAIPDLPNRSSTAESTTTPEAESSRRAAGRPKGAKNWRAPPVSTAEQRIEEELQRDIDLALEQNTGLELDMDGSETASQHESSTINYNLPQPNDRQASPAAQASSSSNLPVGAYPLYPGPSLRDPPGPRADTLMGNTDTISMSPTLLATEFDDDPDVANCLLSEPERVLKERIWVTANEDWLRQDHAKRIKKELLEAEMREKGLDPAKYTKDGRKKLKGSQWRADGSRKAGKWGDVSYLKDPIDPERRRNMGRAGSNIPAGEEGTPTAEELAERGGEAGDGRMTVAEERPDAGNAVKKMMVHRLHAYSSASRRIDLDAVSRLYQLGPLDSSSSQGSEDPESPARRRLSSTPASQTPRQQRPEEEGSQSILKSSKHSVAATRREAAKKKNEQPATQEDSGEKSASPDAAGPSGTAAATARSSEPADASDEDEEDEEITAGSPSAAAAPAAGNRAGAQNQALASQPHTPASTSASTLSVLDDGSVEEVVGTADACEDDEEADYGPIQIRQRSGESDDEDDEEDDPDDFVDDDEDAAEGEDDLNDAFAGTYQPRRRQGESGYEE